MRVSLLILAREFSAIVGRGVLAMYGDAFKCITDIKFTYASKRPPSLPPSLFLFRAILYLVSIVFHSNIISCYYHIKYLYRLAYIKLYLQSFSFFYCNTLKISFSPLKRGRSQATRFLAPRKNKLTRFG